MSDEKGIGEYAGVPVVPADLLHQRSASETGRAINLSFANASWRLTLSSPGKLPSLFYSLYLHQLRHYGQSCEERRAASKQYCE